jgi:hypothetical protein
MSIFEMLHEQLIDYSNQLKEVEKEIVRKYKAGEDYHDDLKKARGLKMMKDGCVKMMVEKR